MKRVLLTTFILSSVVFGASGAELTKANCSSCHILTTPTPDMVPNMKAPAMDAVMFHMKLVKKNKELKSFIVDYVQNPDVSKSVCESNKVQKFGVMPSLKGKVSKEDLDSIANYIVATFPSEKFVKMITEIQRNDKMSSLVNSPFLINNPALPHTTKMLLESWDKGTLGLTKNQKSLLLTIRKETMRAVKRLKKEIKIIEKDIIEAMYDGENPSSLDGKVDEVSKLKAEATKVHLKCISDTIKVLTDKQLEHLLPFWDM